MDARTLLPSVQPRRAPGAVGALHITIPLVPPREVSISPPTLPMRSLRLRGVEVTFAKPQRPRVVERGFGARASDPARAGSQHRWLPPNPGEQAEHAGHTSAAQGRLLRQKGQPALGGRQSGHLSHHRSKPCRLATQPMFLKSPKSDSASRRVGRPAGCCWRLNHPVQTQPPTLLEGDLVLTPRRRT